MNHKSVTPEEFRTLMRRAQNLAKTIGHRAAAGFLRNRGISFEVAFWMIFGRFPRTQHCQGA